MDPLDALKFVLACYPQVKNNGALANNAYVDTQGAAGVLFLVAIGVTDVAIGSGNASTPPIIQEDDDPAFGSPADVAGAELAAVIGSGDDGKLFAIRVNLLKTHARYMRVKAPTAGNNTGANACIIALLSGLQRAPESAADRGLEAYVVA